MHIDLYVHIVPKFSINIFLYVYSLCAYICTKLYKWDTTECTVFMGQTSKIGMLLYHVVSINSHQKTLRWTVDEGNCTYHMDVPYFRGQPTSTNTNYIEMKSESVEPTWTYPKCGFWHCRVVLIQYFQQMGPFKKLRPSILGDAIHVIAWCFRGT